ncbi:flagellar export protein FliJ [Aquidulcibacter sp.]|uniref:flagellar export protein FliJ n=1 Tax=Aquidulcibacter sp. TaxID=2052990 RepID=UPI0025C29873|nr:flagellar FliJ family protein [Aquidulcibacter sp.]MCA3692474.1 flagellar FliJ family protein [Aquidulcibacter sp.]
MKTGSTLIKLAKHKVDSVQMLISAAERTREDIERKKADLLVAEKRERARAEADPAMMGHWVAYSQVLVAQRANLDASLVGVEEQLEALRGDLQAAFEEQKKFEMLEERRLSRTNASKAKREQAFLDEAAMIRAAKRHSA